MICSVLCCDARYPLKVLTDSHILHVQQLMLSIAPSEHLRRLSSGTCTPCQTMGSESCSSIAEIPKETSCEVLPHLILVSTCKYRVWYRPSPQSAGGCNCCIGSVSSPVFHINQWVLQCSPFLTTTLCLHTNQWELQAIGSTHSNPHQACPLPWF